MVAVLGISLGLLFLVFRLSATHFLAQLVAVSFDLDESSSLSDPFVFLFLFFFDFLRLVNYFGLALSSGVYHD